MALVRPAVAGGSGAAVLSALTGAGVAVLTGSALRWTGAASPRATLGVEGAPQSRPGQQAMDRCGPTVGGRFRRGHALRAHRLRRCRACTGSALR